MSGQFPGTLRLLPPAFLALVLAFAAGSAARASDHDDTPLLRSIPRHDGRITDLYAFARGDRLVLCLCTNPAIPRAATGYLFPPDLTLRFHIDNHSGVSFDDPVPRAVYGGTILDPGRISEDLLFEVRFEDGGQRLRTEGLPGRARSEVRLFTGLTDDPFIRGPRIGRNVASVVLEVPLSAVLADQPAILVWATSKVPEVRGPLADHGGRSLRSQFPENLLLNDHRPRDQFRVLGVVPDVLIYDTSRPALFPNGRELADDVVDMVGDPRILATDFPFPTHNDVPFLDVFPYLAPPHRP